MKSSDIVKKKLLRTSSACAILAVIAGGPILSSSLAIADEPEATKAEKPAPTEELVVLGKPPELFRASDASSISRFDLAIEKTPAAVSVITSDLLESAKIKSLEDASRFVPGLVSLGLNGFGEPRSSFEARGVNVDLTTSFKLDNYSFAFQGLLDMVGLERIEFVRGPSAIGYGQASYGGIINLVTKKPQKEAFYSASVDYGSYNTYGLSGDLTGPLNEDGSLRFRLGVGYRDGNSFRAGEKSDIATVVPTIAYDINDDTEVSFIGYFQNAGNVLGGSLPVFRNAAGQLVLPNETLLPRSTFMGNSERNNSDNQIRSAIAKLQHKFDDTTKMDLVLTYSKSKLSVVTSYAAPFAPVSLNAADTANYGRIDTYTQVLYDNNRYMNAELSVQKQFEAFGQEHTVFVLGGYQSTNRQLGYAAVCTPRINVFNFKTSDFPGTFVSTADADNQTGNFCYGLGLYEKSKDANIGVQGHFNITSKLSLLLGVRYDSLDRYNVESDHGLSQSVIRRDGTVVLDGVKDEISTRVGAVYQFTDEINGYATYVTGFRPQSGVIRTGGIVNNEVGKLYEIGSKSVFNDGALSINAAMFILQVGSSSVRDPANLPGQMFVIPGGKNRRWGGEIEAVGRITENINISTNYAYVEGKTTANAQRPALVGTPLAVGSNHKAGVFVNYTFDKDATLGGLNLNTGVTYTGSQLPRRGFSPGYRIPSYTLWDAGASYAITEKVQISASVKNLTDRTYLLPTADTYGVLYGTPRTYLVGFRIVK